MYRDDCFQRKPKTGFRLYTFVETAGTLYMLACMQSTFLIKPIRINEHLMVNHVELDWILHRKSI